MTLPLSPEILAAAYDYLLTTPPFSNWNLPDSEEASFKLSRRKKEFGRYQLIEGRHTITASIHSIAHTYTLMRFMAHEMVHLHLQIMGWESRSQSEEVHNAAFGKFAAQICKVHGFDPKEFY
jgi:hypothetical protein